MLIKKERKYLFVFLLALAVSIIMFVPFVIYDRGIFLFYGDYNVQQIPFYQSCVESIRSGNIFYSFKTDLGSGFLGAYSFYLLGSPFFYIACLFPSTVTPYLMAPLYCLKFATAAVTSYGFIKRFTKNADNAVIGALLYAFSGFNVYNIFFNHFNDVTAFFPLMLIALDELVENNRKGVFALSVALMAMLNYFFFFGQVVFLFIYFFIRLASKGYKNFKWTKVISIATESLIGVGISAAFLLPSVLFIMGNPRTDNLYTGMNAFVYNSPQRYLAIIQSFFFPPDLPARPNFFADANAKWASLSAYLPLFSVAGVLAFIKNNRGHFLRRTMIVLFVMTFIPIANSAFYAFNSSFYTRWFYMLILLMALATSITLDNDGIELQYGIKSTVFITILFSLIGIMPKEVDGELKWFSIPPYPDRFWAYVAISILSMMILTILVVLFKNNREKFTKAVALSVVGTTLVYSIIFIALGKTHSYDDDFILDQCINAGENIDLNDGTFFRVDEYEGMDNTTLFWGYNSIRFFHSCVSPSIMEFYPTVGVKRDVSSKPGFNLYTLRAFLSVKYMFCNLEKDEQPSTQGFVHLDNMNGYAVYENTNFINMGYTYDYYITEDEYYELDESAREKLLVKAIVLTDAQVEKYGQYYKHLNPDNNNYSYNDFVEQCRKRNESSCYEFTETKRGFNAKINSSDANLLFFSVPFDKGFKAYINGVETEVERVTVGFSAVEIPEGEVEVEFVYTPAGLYTGLIITVISVLTLITYLAVSRKFKTKGDTNAAELEE